jgi:alpha-tubulin suppressor-like RCC1 family protein
MRSTHGIQSVLFVGFFMVGCGGAKKSVDALPSADVRENQIAGRDANAAELGVYDTIIATTEDAAIAAPAETGNIDQTPIVNIDANVTGSVADAPNADQSPKLNNLDVASSADAVIVTTTVDTGNVVKDAPALFDATQDSPTIDAASSDQALTVNSDAALPDSADVAKPVVDAGSPDELVVSCAVGMALCNKTECVDLKTNASNCGYCGYACPAAHGADVCVNGMCAVSFCETGWGDCDGVAYNGCESDLGSTNAHCGRCSVACQSLESCIKGVCECSGGMGYCNNVCTNLANDPQNCGVCGTKCGWGCVDGACIYPSDIAAHDQTSCAVMSDNSLFCWGQTDFSASCDYEGAKNSSKPLKVSNLANVSQVAVGQQFICVLLLDGTVSCWGMGFYGQLGNGNDNFSNDPVTVPGLAGVTQLVAGESHVCALRTNGEVWCWGDNEYGATGTYYDSTNTKSGYQLSPYLVSVGVATQIAAGVYHTCALLKDNTVMCWGYDDYGELGRITAEDQFSNHISADPVKVENIGAGNIVAVKASFGKTCALIDTGSVVCWGVMSLIEETYLSDLSPDAYASAIAPYLIPVAATGAANTQAIGMGDEHICAIQNDRTLDCWGCNWSYQVGAGPLPTPGRETWSEVATPLALSGLANVQKIALGRAHSCALLADHSIKCWGNAYCGALGDGGTSTGMVQMTTVLTPNAVSH